MAININEQELKIVSTEEINSQKIVNDLLSDTINMLLDSIIIENEAERKRNNANAAELADKLDHLITKAIDNNNEDKTADIKENSHSTEIEDEVYSEIKSLNDEYNLVEAINKNPVKLGLFSIRVVNAIANSFMGVPAAAIIIAADQILSGQMLLFMSTPDKIFIIALATAILITYLILAYKTEAKVNNHSEISSSISSLFQLSTIIDLSTKTDYVSRAKSEAILEKSISKVRNNDKTILNKFPPESVYFKLLQNEISFSEACKDLTDEQKMIKYRTLYKAMSDIRNDIKNIPESYIIGDTLIDTYISSYIEIANEQLENPDTIKEWYLLNLKLQDIENKHVLETKNKEFFGKVGNIVGSINAVVNGILACTFGIGGLTAFAIIFFPTFSIPMSVIIPISIALFLAGTIHSGTITKGFMKNSFENFGATLDKEKTLQPNKSMGDWISFLASKAYENKKSLLTSLVTAMAITTLSIVSVVIFISTTPISGPVLIAIAAFVGSLTFVSCNTSFNSVLMAKEREKRAQKVLIDNLLSDEQKKVHELANSTKKRHNIIAITTTISLSIIFMNILPVALGTLTPIMIATTIGFTSYILLGIFDSKDITAAQNISEKTTSDIVKTRVRVLISVVFGSSFAIAAGPAIAKIIFATLVATSPVFAAITSIGCGLLLASAIYYVMPMIFWDAALRPSYRLDINSLPKVAHDNKVQSNEKNDVINTKFTAVTDTSIRAKDQKLENK